MKVDQKISSDNTNDRTIIDLTFTFTPEEFLMYTAQAISEGKSLEDYLRDKYQDSLDRMINHPLDQEEK